MNKDNMLSQIRCASRDIIRQVGILENRFSKIGSPSQCHALVELDSQGVMSIGQLSDALNLEKSTTSRLVTQLIEKGICYVHLDENDLRNKLISLTKKGLTLVNKIHQDANLQVKIALNLMSDKEKAIVLEGLTIYAKTLKRSALYNQYLIRKLRKNDMPQLIHLVKKIWAEFGFDSSHPSASLFENELQKTYEIYIPKRSNYYVLVNNKNIVGGVGYAPLKGLKNVCELKGMYLSSQIRGLGFGSMLLRKALQDARKEGFKNCYLETMLSMYQANILYQKFGFIKLDKPLGKTGHTWTNCWYIKNLE